MTVWSAKGEPSAGRGPSPPPGEAERRAKQKRAARSTLEQALGLFQALGAPLWAQRARDDLARAGGATPPSGELAGQAPTARSEEVLDMEPKTATTQLPGQLWRRIVIVAAVVSAMVGGLVAVTGPTMASEPGAGELRLQAPWADPSCRELTALPKRGWACESSRP